MLFLATTLQLHGGGNTREQGPGKTTRSRKGHNPGEQQECQGHKTPDPGRSDSIAAQAQAAAGTTRPVGGLVHETGEVEDDIVLADRDLGLLLGVHLGARDGVGGGNGGVLDPGRQRAPRGGGHTPRTMQSWAQTQECSTPGACLPSCWQAGPRRAGWPPCGRAGGARRQAPPSAGRQRWRAHLKTWPVRVGFHTSTSTGVLGLGTGAARQRGVSEWVGWGQALHSDEVAVQLGGQDRAERQAMPSCIRGRRQPCAAGAPGWGRGARVRSTARPPARPAATHLGSLRMR